MQDKIDQLIAKGESSSAVSQIRAIPVFAPNGDTLSAIGAPFAGFWIRVAAALIDGLILLIPSILISMLFGMAGLSGIGELLRFALGVGYYVYFIGGAHQATPGKRLLGIHVMRTNGASITYLRALGRYFAQILSAMILFIGYIMVAFTKEKTALHDLICDTRVVYGKK